MGPVGVGEGGAARWAPHVGRRLGGGVSDRPGGERRACGAVRGGRSGQRCVDRSESSSEGAVRASYDKAFLNTKLVEDKYYEIGGGGGCCPSVNIAKG